MYQASISLASLSASLYVWGDSSLFGFCPLSGEGENQPKTFDREKSRFIEKTLDKSSNEGIVSWKYAAWNVMSVVSFRKTFEGGSCC